MEEQKVNNEVAELIKAHNYEAKVVDNHIEVNFKEELTLETWIYPKKLDYGIQTRFDIGVKFKNGTELYEAFGDVADTLEASIHKNLENFSRSSLHVFLDAFNDTNTYDDKEQWQCNDLKWDVFIGNYNLKNFGEKEIQIPENLFQKLQNIVSEFDLTEKYYFVRTYYAHMENKTMNIEFMINNTNFEHVQEELEQLDWMQSETFYSIRNFFILKRVDK